MAFKITRLKKLLLSYSATSFFPDIYRMKNFDSSIPVSFGEISMSFLNFLSQKTYPGKCLRPEVIFSRRYLKKCSIWSDPSAIINLSDFKNAIKSEPLGNRG